MNYYLIDIINGLTVLLGVSVFLACWVVVIAILYADSVRDDVDAESVKHLVKRTCLFIGFVLFLLIFIPSEKTLALWLLK